MDKKYLFISEVLTPPFDEGIKNVAFSVHKHLSIRALTLSVTRGRGSKDVAGIRSVRINKLFANYELRKLLAGYAPDIILYLPEASITFNSFVRARILKWMSGHSKVVMIGVKQVDHTPFQRKLIVKIFRPDFLLLLGRFDREFFLKNGVKVKTMPPAVDNVRFCKATREEKERIRSEYGIPNDKTVILHVGHIRMTRNVQCFSKIQEIEGIQVVIVGSTSTPTEHDLKEKLLSDGVLVIDKYISDISSVYKMADAYVFPVHNKIACIDMPLSILEAMACNLPVITTRFGGLEDNFNEYPGFRYFDTAKELDELVRSVGLMNRSEINNVERVKKFTWNKFTDEIIDACNQLI